MTHAVGLVDSNCYVTNRSSCYEALFGATCRSSVLICPRIQRQRPACQLWPMSSLFLLDVYGKVTFVYLTLGDTTWTSLECYGTRSWISVDMKIFVQWSLYFEIMVCNFLFSITNYLVYVKCCKIYFQSTKANRELRVCQYDQMLK